jgi:hypothetical protein
MVPFMEQPGGKLAAWGPGTRWEDGALENWTGSGWQGWGSPNLDSFVYLRTTSKAELAAQAEVPVTTVAPLTTVPPVGGATTTKAAAGGTKPTTSSPKKKTKKTLAKTTKRR